MEYYRTLNLEREPFSNSPDPGLFFDSKQHLEALQKLEIGIRLKRGLNVITGDVGTGKTTLSRQLIQRISHDSTLNYFLILDPGFHSTTEFLSCILNHFTGHRVSYNTLNSKDDSGLKEQIKKYLFSQGVDKNITTVLMIDEAQKLPIFCLEVLRELLNYETNDNKLLQIIIFAQNEFSDTLHTLKNFKDRINFRYSLSPLGFIETKKLIQFRLEKSAVPGTTTPYFSFFAYIAIYRYTRGFPRRIINFCHHVILGLIIKNRTGADFFFINACAKKIYPSKGKHRFSLVLYAMLALVLFGGLVIFDFNKITDLISDTLHDSPAPIETRILSKIQPITPMEPEFSAPIRPVEKSIVTETVIEKPDPVTQLPEFYGSLSVSKDQTLSSMIQIVYGSYQNKFLYELVKKNSTLKNPNQVDVGTRIKFPIIPQTNASWEKDHIAIVFSKENDFKKAFLTASQYQKMGIDVRILSGWEDQKGFLFSIIVDRPFKNLSDAKLYRKKLTGIKTGVCEKIFSGNTGRKIL